jgi:heat shock protein HslJ
MITPRGGARARAGGPRAVAFDRDGTLRGELPCGPVTGAWRSSGDGLRLRDLEAHGAACGDPAAAAADAACREALREVRRWTWEDGFLVLAGDRTSTHLVFVPGT